MLSSAFVTDGRCLWLLLQLRRQQTTSSAFVLTVSVNRDEIPVVMWTTSSESSTDVQYVKYLWFQLVNGIVFVWHFTVLIFWCEMPMIFGSACTYENFYMYTCLGCWVSCMDDNICHMEHFLAKYMVCTFFIIPDFIVPILFLAFMECLLYRVLKFDRTKIKFNKDWVINLVGPVLKHSDGTLYSIKALKRS
jgi:hypothetical protein